VAGALVEELTVRAMDKQLEAVGDSQGKLSATADSLKKTFERMRGAALALSILGALLAALASQNDGDVRRSLALASTVTFAIMSFITARFLSAGRAQLWTRVRAASEALKREAYKCAARAAPYDNAATSGLVLLQQADEIEKAVDDLSAQFVQAGRGRTPVAAITPDEYVAKRIDGQIAYFEKAARTAQTKAGRLRALELTLAFTTTVIAAVVGFIDKEPIAGLDFDFAALIAVLTTISGTILAYIEASRYDFLATTFRATERRLRGHKVAHPAGVTVPSPDWSAYVERSEMILQEENTSWVAKFGKP
jgi:hypothetical protein